MKQATAKRDLFVSAIVYLRNYAHILEAFTDELVEVLAANYTDFEVLFVDDASSDATPATMEQLLGRHEGIRYLRLTRGFGREVAVYAGMQSAIGDYMVVLSLQTDPPTLIPDLIDRIVAHGGIVFGTCERRFDEAPLFHWTRSLYVWITHNVFGIPLARNATQLMAFSRQALNAYLEIKDRFRHTRLLTAYIGYTQESFDYQQVPRCQPVVKRSLRDGVSAGIRIVFANSSYPLRTVAWMGVLVGLANLSLAIASRYWRGAGLPPLVVDPPVQSAGMFVVVTAILAVLAEYVTSLTEESRNRPLYYLHDEKTSSVLLANQGRRNITA